MDLNEIRTLHTVVDEGSMNRAATHLELTQPTVSRQIRAIEEEIGTQIFYRRSTGAVLTPAGEEFVLLTRGILLELNRTIDLMKVRYSRRSVFKIACTQTTAHAILAPFIADLNPPIIDLVIVDATNADKQLEIGADLAVTTLRPPPDRRSIEVAKLIIRVQALESAIRTVSKDHHFIDLENFKGEEWILPRTGVPNALFSKYPAPSEIRKRYVTTGVVAQSLAANGYGYAIVTELPALGLAAKTARVDGEAVTCPLYASWDARHEASEELQSVAERLSEWLKTAPGAAGLTPENDPSGDVPESLGPNIVG